MLGYHPEVILAGRRINDNMGKFIAETNHQAPDPQRYPVKDAKVTVLGLTFKEDVPDLRNSHVIDVINELKSYGFRVFVHDPVPVPRKRSMSTGSSSCPGRVADGRGDGDGRCPSPIP